MTHNIKINTQKHRNMCTQYTRTQSITPYEDNQGTYIKNIAQYAHKKKHTYILSKHEYRGLLYSGHVHLGTGKDCPDS